MKMNTSLFPTQFLEAINYRERDNNKKKSVNYIKRCKLQSDATFLKTGSLGHAVGLQFIISPKNTDSF